MKKKISVLIVGGAQGDGASQMLLKNFVTQLRKEKVKTVFCDNYESGTSAESHTEAMREHFMRATYVRNQLEPDPDQSGPNQSKLFASPDLKHLAYVKQVPQSPLLTYLPGFKRPFLLKENDDKVEKELMKLGFPKASIKTSIDQIDVDEAMMLLYRLAFYFETFLLYKELIEARLPCFGIGNKEISETMYGLGTHPILRCTVHIPEPFLIHSMVSTILKTALPAFQGNGVLIVSVGLLHARFLAYKLYEAFHKDQALEQAFDLHILHMNLFSPCSQNEFKLSQQECAKVSALEYSPKKIDIIRDQDIFCAAKEGSFFSKEADATFSFAVQHLYMNRYVIPDWDDAKKKLVETLKGKVLSQDGTKITVALDGRLLKKDVRSQLGINRQRITPGSSQQEAAASLSTWLQEKSSDFTIEREDDALLITFPKDQLSLLQAALSDWDQAANQRQAAVSTSAQGMRAGAGARA